MTHRISKTTQGPVLRGDAFQAAYKAGKGARFLYDAAKAQHRKPAPFSKVEGALDKLANRIAWRLVMVGQGAPRDRSDKVVALATYPNLHLIEIAELLALVFADAPVATYHDSGPAASFWNWWDWAAGNANAANDHSDTTITDMRHDERLAAGAAAVAVLNARAAVTLAC